MLGPILADLGGDNAGVSFTSIEASGWGRVPLILIIIMIITIIILLLLLLIIITIIMYITCLAV